MVQIINTNAVYIPSVDGKDLFISNNYKDSNLNGYNLKNKNGDYNLSKFINTLDFSLDLIKLREIYEKVYRRRDFSFFKNHKEFTQRVINVTFKYSNKEFNKLKTDTYIKFGYMVSDEDFSDCVCIRDGELVGIRINETVNSPISNELLGKYFYFDDGVYKARTNITTLNSVANIREELYKNGFICNGIKYVRFKRSSGSSRVGKCLFIDEKLYYRMHKWEMCGIKVKNGSDIDLASLEPYIALTLSSIIDVIHINPENILVVDDYSSVFTDKVVATRLIEGRLQTKPETVEISNKIWDGQSLMDISLFGKYSDKGMLLLRSRFFKSCCFNANIQKWFADNGITDVKQLNGYTRATKIEDVKLITTPSSIKYLKFGTLEKWFDTMESVFGIVKHEKPTHFFDGRMVQTHYQLINTLQMTPEEVEQLVKPSLDYARMIKTDPAVLRHYIGYKYQSPDDVYYTQNITSKNEIIYKMLGINDKFANTKLYCQFRDNLIKSFLKNLRCGHILVKGNYSTLCGNPIEMLKQAIGAFDGSTVIETNTVHSINFDNNVDILGSRSPHVTIGNILLTKNILREEITKYMNPTREIIYINSICDNILERLSGADFDSDTILLTDNKILINAAKRNYNNFPVPTKLVESININRKYTSEQQADLDVKTSVNKIGEIINLSQELNSLLWNRINNGESIDSVMDLYCDIAQLDVMSNLEIDSAKRENPANNTYELQCLKQKYDQRDNKNRHIRPLFFKYIDGYKGYRDDYHIYREDDEGFTKCCVIDKYGEALQYKKDSGDIIHIERGRMSYQKYETAMDYLQSSINKFRTCRLSRKNLLKFSECLIPIDNLSGQVYSYQIKEVINSIRETKNLLINIWKTDNEFSKKEKHDFCDGLYNECINKLSKIKLNKKTMRFLLTLLDKNQYLDIRKYMFDILFRVENADFYELISDSKDEIFELVEDGGTINILGFGYSKIQKS